VKITVLGSGSGRGDAMRNASAYWLESREATWLIDAGDGVLKQVLSLKLDLHRLDGVLITHTHPDHVSGLFFLLQAIKLAGRSRPLEIHMPAPALAVWPEMLRWFQLNPASWPFTIKTEALYSGIVVKRSDLQFTALANTHLPKDGSSPQSFSLRMDENSGGRLLYSSDVADLGHLHGAANGVTLFLSEAAHVAPETALSFARQHNIKQLVYTHISTSFPLLPAHDAAVEIITAHDGVCLSC